MNVLTRVILFFILLIFSRQVHAQCACVWLDASGVMHCVLYPNCGNGNKTACENQSNGTNFHCLIDTDCPIYPGSTSGCAPECIGSSGACWYNGTTCSATNICGIVLPVTLSSFYGLKSGNDNVLTWTTATEHNNNLFIVSKSLDGKVWKEKVRLPGSGDSQIEITYEVRDVGVEKEINYYKLAQIDFNGDIVEYKAIVIDNRIETFKIIKSCNTMGQEVDQYYKGIVINYYDDGTTRKIMQ